jgi:hypothetical protein
MRVLPAGFVAPSPDFILVSLLRLLLLVVSIFLSGAVVKNSISFMSRPREAMPEWVVHCEVNQRHMRRSHPTRETALKDACSQLLQGHAVNRIVGSE